MSISPKKQPEKNTKYIWPSVLKKPFGKLQALCSGIRVFQYFIIYLYCVVAHSA
jgi:hypothetical protein